MNPTDESYRDWKERNLPWIEVFFRRPDDDVERWLAFQIDRERDKISFGTLYLLRRELVETGFSVEKIQPESVFSARPLEKRPFASTMLTCTGIDLLGKFLAGHDADDDRNQKCQSRNGQRFKAFCKRFLHISEEEMLWELRNSMMHSFGLYLSARTNRTYRLTSDLDGQVVKRIEGENWQISASSLYWAFIAGVEEYEQAVRANYRLEENFARMFPKYGTLEMTR